MRKANGVESGDLVANSLKTPPLHGDGVGTGTLNLLEKLFDSRKTTHGNGVGTEQLFDSGKTPHSHWNGVKREKLNLSEQLFDSRKTPIPHWNGVGTGYTTL